MKSHLLGSLVVMASLTALLAPSPYLSAGVIVTNPDDLPPPGGAGWYSAPGQSVSFHVEYGTNQGLPEDDAFTGVFIAAHDMIVDNFSNITRSYTNNDEWIQFDAKLTASVTVLAGSPLDESGIVTLDGNMKVRLANRLGHPTGTFPLTAEAMSFTLTSADLGGHTNTPMVNIQISPSLVSTGQLSVTAIGVGRYEVTSSLKVYSEMAAYDPAESRWLPYWPDTNAPTAYTLRPLQGPKISRFVVVTNAARDTYLEFPMRKYVRYTLDFSPDLGNWIPLKTNEWSGLRDHFSHTHPGGGSGQKGFYRIRSTLWPASP